MSVPAINFTGPDWTLFEQWLVERLMETYQNLANPATDGAATDRLRGQAQLITMLLDFKHTQPQDLLTL